MGCTQSTTDRRSLSQNEIDERIDSIKETCNSTCGVVSLRYAYLSQRGYYPNAKRRPNEDSYIVTQKFAGRESDAFFGVFDGHGKEGEKCSQYVRDTLSSLLAKDIGEVRVINGRVAPNISKDLIEIPEKQLETVIEESHKECNRRMHASKRVDDSVSGTTSISVYLHGNLRKITVNNVGDSRAVMGSVATPEQQEAAATASSSLIASPLSCDHTPWRRDERERIKKKGGRILSWGQLFDKPPTKMFGKSPVVKDEKGELELWETCDRQKVLGEVIDETGDPPRVWCRDRDFPGAAFTRSFGDEVAERKAGLFAEPEILIRELTPQDKIIFLASDGVFEVSVSSLAN
mmetsp:Transcript_15893/g.28834  ORF Transcript_15893/g.28834 Transcript_15893/m.28834 type:complete len:347 (-) Transcript_15893:296-1336(-)